MSERSTDLDHDVAALRLRWIAELDALPECGCGAYYDGECGCGNYIDRHEYLLRRQVQYLMERFGT